MQHSPSDEKITNLLRSASQGDRHAASSLMPLLYDELKRLARDKMSHERPGQTLQPTALVHEAYLRVVGQDDPGWDSARHFFAAAAAAMRLILIDRARRKARPKHGGGRERVDLDDAAPGIEAPTPDVLDLHAAIEELEAEDPQKGQIAVLRCFGGLSAEETAATLDVSLSTVEREWRFTKAWLRQKLDGGFPD